MEPPKTTITRTASIHNNTLNDFFICQHLPSILPVLIDNLPIDHREMIAAEQIGENFRVMDKEVCVFTHFQRT
jgi:hypothetical protein